MRIAMSIPVASIALSKTVAGVGKWVRQTVDALQPNRGGEDWDLWRRATAGDAPSAKLLVQRMTPQAHGIALQMMRKNEDAQDVVQDAFLRLWRAKPDDTHGAKLSTYFNAIVINRCKTVLTQLRELATDDETLFDLVDGRQARDAAPEDGGLSSGGRERIRLAMGQLPARQRMALGMWAYTGADAAEIASSLDIEVNAAHQLLHRAKQGLKNLLQGEMT